MDSVITRRELLQTGFAASVATVLFRVNPVFGQTDSKITSTRDTVAKPISQS